MGVLSLTLLLLMATVLLARLLRPLVVTHMKLIACRASLTVLQTAR